MRAVYNTPHEAFCIALFLTYSWICEVHRSSKPKRTKTPFTICMSAHLLPIGAFSMGDTMQRYNIFLKDITVIRKTFSIYWFMVIRVNNVIFVIAYIWISSTLFAKTIFAFLTAHNSRKMKNKIGCRFFASFECAVLSGWITEYCWLFVCIISSSRASRCLRCRCRQAGRPTAWPASGAISDFS